MKKEDWYNVILDIYTVLVRLLPFEMFRINEATEAGCTNTYGFKEKQERTCKIERRK